MATAGLGWAGDEPQVRYPGRPVLAAGRFGDTGVTELGNRDGPRAWDRVICYGGQPPMDVPSTPGVWEQAVPSL